MAVGEAGKHGAIPCAAADRGGLFWSQWSRPGRACTTSPAMFHTEFSLKWGENSTDQRGRSGRDRAVRQEGAKRQSHQYKENELINNIE